MRTIAIMNNKGGVGKTVTSINLADILVRDHHKKVVVVDCDGQMNLTRFYLPKFDPEINVNLADILLGDGEAVWSDNVVPLQPRLDLLAASQDLYDLDRRAIQFGKNGIVRLDDFVACAREDGDVDYMIFDCPPGYTVASVGALMAADEVVIPMLLDGFSHTGMEDMQHQIDVLRRTNPCIRISGVLLTQWHNSEVVRKGEAYIRNLSVPVFRQTIRRTDKVPESTYDRQPMSVYSPTSAAARDYRAWVEELLGEEAPHV